MSLDEKLQAFFDRIDLRLQAVEQKLDNRLSDVEKRCDKLEVSANKQFLFQKKVSKDVADLKVTVNILEQKRLEKQVTIKGIPENDNENVEALVVKLFYYLNNNFEPQFLASARRIGVKKNNQHRLILAELVTCDHKLSIITNIAAKDINCSLITVDNTAGTTLGSSNDKIYVSDHLTPYMANVFFRARQLKKTKKIQYAWSKLGMIFVKKDDNSRAVNIKSVEHLTAYERYLEVESYEDDEAEQVESDFETSSKASTESKRQRSPENVMGRRSPSKRTRRQPVNKKV